MLLIALNDSRACNSQTLSESLYTCYIYKPNADSHNSLYEQGTLCLLNHSHETKSEIIVPPS